MTNMNYSRKILLGIYIGRELWNAAIGTVGFFDREIEQAEKHLSLLTPSKAVGCSTGLATSVGCRSDGDFDVLDLREAIWKCIAHCTLWEDIWLAALWGRWSFDLCEEVCQKAYPGKMDREHSLVVLHGLWYTIGIAYLDRRF